MSDTEGNGRSAAGGPAHQAEGIRQLGGQLHARLDRMEQLLQATEPRAERAAVPAWQRATQGEQRWAVTMAIVVAVGLQWALPPRFTIHPHWLLPLLEIVLLVGLVAASPYRIERHSRPLRTASLILTALVSLANGWSAFSLVRALVHGTAGSDAGPLLMTGAGIWITNIIVFALWYWEWDRGGPASRAAGASPYPDFLFPQMQERELAPAHWEPGFLDYLYVSFTNATAFSPTDVMPLSRWAKMLMLGQSLVSLITVVLVIARAVNIFK
ncbi:hypothetical protein ACWGCW_38170 [Streptomyces sp. NPDC054933]